MANAHADSKVKVCDATEAAQRVEAGNTKKIFYI
jgi:hypothetical protein